MVHENDFMVSGDQEAIDHLEKLLVMSARRQGRLVQMKVTKTRLCCLIRLLGTPKATTQKSRLSQTQDMRC